MIAMEDDHENEKDDEYKPRERRRRRRKSQKTFVENGKAIDPNVKGSESFGNRASDAQVYDAKSKLESIRANRDYACDFVEIDYDFNPEYDPEFHPIKVLEVMSSGACREELCIELGILPSVLCRWFQEYKEFHDCIVEGEWLAKAWWKAQERLNIHNQQFNNTLFSLAVINRFGYQKRSTKEQSDNLLDKRFEADIKSELDVSNMSIEKLQELKDADGKTKKKTNR